jgi:hypothetical protein
MGEELWEVGLEVARRAGFEKQVNFVWNGHGTGLTLSEYPFFAPIGGALYELMPTWRILVQARAIENLVYVVVSQNLWGKEEGLAVIAGPEGVLTEGSGPGVVVAELDLDRLSWLREREQQMVIPKPYRAIPGILKERRPSLYAELVDSKAPARDFYYFREERS